MFSLDFHFENHFENRLSNIYDFIYLSSTKLNFLEIFFPARQ
jgi:hypothetical protein